FTGSPRHLRGVQTSESHALAGADFDGDGYSDLVVGLDWYVGGPSGIPDQPSGSIAVAASGPFAPVGDVDSDGYDDAVIGDPAADCGPYACGRIYLCRGGASGLTLSASIRDPAFLPDDEFGTAIAGAGDLDGDGHNDVVASSPFNNGSGFIATYL